MEFLDEESRPSRFLFQSRASSSSTTKPETLKINKIQAAICITISSLFFSVAIFFVQSETLQFLLIWLAFSLIIGPFAPISITGGDIRVGVGSIIEFPDPDLSELDESKKRTPNRRPKPRRSDDPPSISPLPVPETLNSSKTEKKSSNSAGNGSAILEEREWTDEDFDMLKKQISKHPVGEPRRWELIAEAFRGRHGLESVIKTAKSMSEKKPGGNDSFAQFLKQRKPPSKQIEAVDSSVGLMEGEDFKKENENGSSWSSGEDIALLNALKAFPKDVSMRWEKISAAVPGKSKACCMKRVTELKRDFRSSKASES